MSTLPDGVYLGSPLSNGEVEHLHTLTPHTIATEAWTCHLTLSSWSDLDHPRDLTADEIAEHDLWTGGAR